MTPGIDEPIKPLGLPALIPCGRAAAVASGRSGINILGLGIYGAFVGYCLWYFFFLLSLFLPPFLSLSPLLSDYTHGLLRLAWRIDVVFNCGGACVDVGARVGVGLAAVGAVECRGKSMPCVAVNC